MEGLGAHRIDGISFGKIVQIREVLLRAQAKGARVIRFESGDPSFGERQVVLGDFSVGVVGLGGAVATGVGASAGSIDLLTAPVMVGAGVVLTTGFVPMVFQ